MTAIEQNIILWQGEDKTVTVALVDGNGAAYGSTSGLTFYLRISPSKLDSTALISKTSGSGITNGTSLITIAFDSTDTETKPPRDYYMECRVIDGSNEEDVVFIGTFTVKPSTTKTV